MDWGLVAEVASAVLAVITYHYHRKYNKAIKTMQDTAKAISDTAKAFADGVLTEDEVKQLYSDWSEVAKETDLDKIAEKVKKILEHTKV